MFEKGLNYDANQCNEKFRSLKHRHKKITDNNEKSGRGRSTWQYYDAMEELLAGDPAVRPIKVVASSTATPAAESTSTGSSATLTQKPPLPPNVLRTRTPSPVRSISPVESVASDEQVTPVIKRRRKNAEAPEWFQDFVSQNERRLDALEAANSALIEISRERNAILKQLAEALTKK